MNKERVMKDPIITWNIENCIYSVHLNNLTANQKLSLLEGMGISVDRWISDASFKEGMYTSISLREFIETNSAQGPTEGKCYWWQELKKEVLDE